MAKKYLLLVIFHHEWHWSKSSRRNLAKLQMNLNWLFSMRQFITFSGKQHGNCSSNTSSYNKDISFCCCCMMKPQTSTHLSWRPRSEQRSPPRVSHSRRQTWWGAGCRWRWSETVRSSRKTSPTWVKAHLRRCKPPRSRTCRRREEIQV